MVRPAHCELITSREAANELGVSPRTLAKLPLRRIVLPSGHRRYFVADVLQLKRTLTQESATRRKQK
jgi:DNA-binding transcriptional MerR regulator